MARYHEKLKDPRWQRKRLEILERDRWRCVRCGDWESTLHVHHGHYERARDPWDYDDADLWTLCEDCHGCIEDELHDVRKAIGRVHPIFLNEIIGQILHALPQLEAEQLEAETSSA